MLTTTSGASSTAARRSSSTESSTRSAPNGLVSALDAATGRLDTAAVSPPQVFDDIVIVGSSGFDWRLGRERPQKVAPGDVRGFDVRTGQLRWTFHFPRAPTSRGPRPGPPALPGSPGATTSGP